MTWTLIGCGDLYNQDREPIWCPWTQKDVSIYDFYIVGDPDAKVDFTHIDDLVEFIVKTIEHPELAENNELNFTSDHISYTEIAELLERYSGKNVDLHIYPLEVMDRVLKDKNDVPEEMKGKSAFSNDFWIIVKGMQGSGRFWRTPGRVHNKLFPSVNTTSFEKYFQGRFRS